MAERIQRINCSFSNLNSLYLAYMPFVQGGGLFVRTNQNIEPGTHVLLVVSLLDEDMIYELDAQVVWLTPKGAEGNKPIGLGMQLIGENRQDFCNKIESYLADMLKSIHATDTM